MIISWKYLRRPFTCFVIWVVTSTWIVPLTAVGQQLGADPWAGTVRSKSVTPELLRLIERGRAAPASVISPRITFTGAEYATAGVALRNREMGAIQISGIAEPVQKAYIYFAYLYSATPPITQDYTLCKPDATSPDSFKCAKRTATQLATGADPCWGSKGIAIYSEDVTKFVTGNGEYQIKVPKAVSARTDGADPWISNEFPAAEGASLVVVGTGSGSVAIYDTGLAGSTFFGTTAYTLSLPGGAIHTPVFWDSIGADGQLGSSRDATIAAEETFINSVQIAGPGADTTSGGATDSDWDGSSGWPLPQLWDDTGHQLPPNAATLGTLTLDVSFVTPNSQYDCLTPVVNVVYY